MVKGGHPSPKIAVVCYCSYVHALARKASRGGGASGQVHKEACEMSESFNIHITIQLYSLHYVSYVDTNTVPNQQTNMHPH